MRRGSNSREPTPLPYAKVGLLGLILAANNTSIWMIFSFLPFMVHHFYPALSTAELGYHAGILGSAFSAGGLVGNIIWGYASDKLGRRPALLMGLLGTALSALLFGFSPSYPLAICARFLWGVLNGNIGVAKTYMGEVTDDSNAARGMALFGVIGGFGRTIGPIIGGFLSSPADSYSIFKGTIFETYPYALPSIVISINCLFVFFVAYFLLPETLPVKSLPSTTKHKSGYVLLNSSEDQDEADDSNPKAMIELSRISNVIHDRETKEGEEEEEDRQDTASTTPAPSDTDDNSLPPDEDNNNNNSSSKKKSQVTFAGRVMVKVIGTSNLAFHPLKGITPADRPVSLDHLDDLEAQSQSQQQQSEQQVEQHQQQLEPLLRYSNGSEDVQDDGPQQLSFLQFVRALLRRKDIFASTLMYGSNAFTVIVMNEVFPLWIVTSPEEGGFAFTSHDIGLATMVCGTVSIVLQITLYPKLVDWYGILATYRIAVAGFGIGCFLTPCVSLVNGWHSTPLTWFVLIVTQLVQSVTATWVLITIFVFINNSCYSHQRATVNAIGQTFASLGRLSGPYLGATLFAWSETNHLQWPFNYYLVFYLLAIISIGNWYLSKVLSPSIVRRKREPKKPVPAVSASVEQQSLTAEESSADRK